MAGEAAIAVQSANLRTVKAAAHTNQQVTYPLAAVDPAQAWLDEARLGQYYEALGFDFDDALKVEDFGAMDDAALTDAGMKKLEIVRFRKKLAE